MWWITIYLISYIYTVAAYFNHYYNFSLPGGKAGLQSGKEVKVQKQSLKDIDDSVLGKGAETVYRNKDGKKIDSKLENLKKKEEERKKAEQDEQFYEWGRG